MIPTTVSKQVMALFSYTPLSYMLRAMVYGSAPASVYADNEAEPNVCLIWEGHSLFVGGDASHPAADRAVCFFMDVLLTPERKKQLGVLKIIYPNNAWRDKLSHAFGGNRVNEYMRSVYSHPDPGLAAKLADTDVQLITAKMRERNNFSMIQEEVESTLGSVEKFFAMGFGYALVLDNQVCGFCTAEYISETECAIGIAVDTAYRRQGHAAHMTACFLGECRRRGLTPYWECWKNNIPSAKTAEGAGFKKLADYPVLLVEFMT